MKRFFKTHYDRAIFAVLAIVLLGSVGWFWLMGGEVKCIRTNPVGVHFEKSVYEPVEWTAAEPAHQTWTKPLPQSAGSEWVYELFTPPSVFLNRSTGQFVVTPPSDLTRTSPAFAIELIAVRRELYRVQLSGYFGEPDAYTAVFSQPGRMGALFAKDGKVLVEPALTLRKFSVRREPPVDARSSHASEPVAFAELHDDRTGESVVLNSREAKFADAPVATVKINSPNGALRDVRTGDVISDGTTVYRINRVTYLPAELLISREEPGASSVDTKVLRPVGGETPAVALQSVESTSSFPRLATGFVTPEK